MWAAAVPDTVPPGMQPCDAAVYGPTADGVLHQAVGALLLMIVCIIADTLTLLFPT